MRTGFRFCRQAVPLVAVVLFLTFVASEALACAVCFSGRVTTPGDRLDAADIAVLAAWEGGAKGYRVLESIKGDAEAAPATIALSSIASAAELPRNKPLLLLRNPLSQQWTSAGAIGVHHAGWLRRLAALGSVPAEIVPAGWPRVLEPTTQLAKDVWRTRLELVAPYLEYKEPLAAEIAHGEFARAPYDALRLMKGQLDALQIAGWLERPQSASRHTTYMVLLGIAGGSAEAALLEQRIRKSRISHDADTLAAMLTADLELRGASRVSWIEQAYFADPDRTMPEIEAALMALSIHGSADAAVPRKRVIEAYRFFIKERKPMAGFVAMELAEWSHWEVTPDYIALLKSGALKDPASRFAVVSYLQRSPHSDAKTALRTAAGKIE